MRDKRRAILRSDDCDQTEALRACVKEERKACGSPCGAEKGSIPATRALEGERPARGVRSLSSPLLDSGLAFAHHAAQLCAQAFDLGELLLHAVKEGRLRLDAFVDQVGGGLCAAAKDSGLD